MDLIVRDCNWCGAHVPHAAGRRGPRPVAHVRASASSSSEPCSHRRRSTSGEREVNLAELLDLGPA